MSRLFAVAYEAAGSLPVALALMTEMDAKIDIRRHMNFFAKRKKRHVDFKRLAYWIENATPYETNVVLESKILMCISTDYDGQDRLFFSNISDEMAERMLHLGEDDGK